MFDKLVYRRWSLKTCDVWPPPVDIHDTQDAYCVEIDWV
jgi:hypothetical protein